jgi:hypothetical protein
VRVYRRRELNEEIADPSRAVELHRIRAAALHDIFDAAPAVAVLDWGKTEDDSKAHEFVDLVIDFVQWALQPPQLQAAGDAALAIGKFLTQAAAGEAVKEGVQWLIRRVRKKQTDGEIADVNISPTPMINIQVVPPQNGGRLSITIQVDGGPYQQ